MKKSLLASSLIALLTSIGTANALTWSGGDLTDATTNTTITCTDLDCVLTPTTGDTLTFTNDYLIINTTSGNENFVFDSGDELNPYILTADTHGDRAGALDFYYSDLDSVLVNADISNISTVSGGYQYGILFKVFNVNNFINIGGSIYSNTEGIYLSQSTAGSFISTADITSTNYNGIYLDSSSIAGFVDISGVINSNSNGIVVGSSSSIAGNFNVGGSINSNYNGVRILNSSIHSFTSSANIISGTNGIYIHDSIIAGQLEVSGDISSNDYGLLFNNVQNLDGDFIVDLIHTGSITSSVSSAIAFGELDNIFNYSGTGALSSADGFADIDMGDGTDTLNILDATVTDLSVYGAETMTITNTTLEQDLTDVNKVDTLLDTTGTTSLTIDNTVFDFTTTATGFVIGDQLTLFTADTIDADWDTLTSTFNMTEFDDLGGYFDTIDNNGTDELVYVFGTTLDNIWDSGVDELLLNNAQVVCDGVDCNLQTRYSQDLISGKIVVSSTGLENLTLVSDQLMSGATGTTSEGVFELSSANLKNLIIDGVIENTNGFGTYFLDSTITESVNISGSITSTNHALYIQNSTVGSLISTGSLYSETNRAISMDGATIDGDFFVSGNIDSYTGLAWLSNTTINGDLSFDINGLTRKVGSFSWGIVLYNGSKAGDMTVTGSLDTGFGGVSIWSSELNSLTIDAEIMTRQGTGSSSYDGLNFFIYDSTVYGDVILSGIMKNYGIRAVVELFGNSVIEGSVISSSDIIAGSASSISLTGLTLKGDFINSGKIIGAEEDTFNASETYGIQIVSSDINAIENTATGIIQGQYGIGLSVQKSDGTLSANHVNNDTDLTIVNNGSIIGTKYAAITMDFTEEHGTAESFDNVLNYSGFGTLDGAVVDIDMNGGMDTLNITNANIEMPTMASVEIVNISDSVLKLSLNDTNKEGVLIDMTSAETLTLTSMLFDVDTSGLTTFDGNQIVLMEVDNITADTSSLGITFNDVSFSTSGLFEVVDNGAGLDQLVFIFDADAQSLAPTQPVSGTREVTGVVSVSVVNNAVVVSQSVMNVMQARQTLVRQHAMLQEKAEFAFASDIQTDIQSIFSALTNAESGIWVQGFGQFDSYDGQVLSNGILSTGYDSSNFGVTFGYDHHVSNNVLLGLATSYASGEVTGEGDSFETLSDTLQFNFYGSYTGETFYLDGILGYGLGVHDQKRNIGSDVASADYYSSQFSAQANLGHVFFVNDNFTLTPYGKAVYMNITQDSYEETGSVNALSMEEIEFRSFQLGGGLEAGYIIKDVRSHWMPRMHVEYAMETQNDSLHVDSTILSTGTSGTPLVTPDMGDQIIRAGLGVTYVDEDGHHVSLDVEMEDRDNYSSHSIFLKGKWMF